MAQRIGPPGSARVAISGNHFGKPYANVFWANLVGGATATQAGFDTWTTNFGDQYYNVFKDILSTGTTINSASAVLFQSSTSVLHSLHTVNQPGLVSAQFLNDASAAVVLSWTSNAYWRGGKPRTYLPGIQASYQANAYNITPAGDTAYTAHGSSWITAINALSAPSISNTQFGFVHFFAGGVLLNPGVFYAITGCQVHPRFGTQRRRLGAWIP